MEHSRKELGRVAVDELLIRESMLGPSTSMVHKWGPIGGRSVVHAHHSLRCNFRPLALVAPRVVVALCNVGKGGDSCRTCAPCELLLFQF